MKNNIILPKGKGNFYAGVLAGEWIYCSMCNVNGLYRKNIKTGEQEYLGRFDKYDSGMGVHERAFLVNNNIFFIPRENRETLIAVYNIDTKEMKYINFPHEYTFVIGQVACSAIDANNAVWVIPCVYDAILRIDKETHEVRRCDNWPKKIAENGISKAKFSDAILHDGKIYICPYDCSGIVIFDPVTETMEMVEIDILNRVYRKMVYYKGKLYLFPENFDHDIVIYDIHTRQIEKCINKPEMSGGEYRAMACVNGRDVWMFPYEGSKIVKFDLTTHGYDVHTFSIDRTRNKKIVNAQFWNAFEMEERALVTMGSAASPYVIVEVDKLQYGTMELSTEETLHRLFDSIEKNTLEVGRCSNIEPNIGSTIYNKLRG